MSSNTEKPSAEAKALSLFLMAYKGKDPSYKQESKHMNRQWERVKLDELSKAEYLQEVNDLLSSFGGYEKVVEKTVKHFIEKTGEWKLKGNDQYCQDAQAVADEIAKK